MTQGTQFRLSALRVVLVNGFFGLTAALGAFVTAILFWVGDVSGLLIGLTLLPAVVVVLFGTTLYIALAAWCILRARRSGYRICVDETASILRDTDGRTVRLDKAQRLSWGGKPPFDIAVLHDTAPEGWRASRGAPARVLGVKVRSGSVLDAICRGDLVVPLVFIRRRWRMARLLRRCTINLPVAPL